MPVTVLFLFTTFTILNNADSQRLILYVETPRRFRIVFEQINLRQKADVVRSQVKIGTQIDFGITVEDGNSWNKN